MKRMISQKLINNLIDLLNNISSGVFAPNKISLDSVADLEISDLGALFPTPTNGKFLAWNNGVLANVEVYQGIDIDELDLTASDFGGTGQLPAENQTELNAETVASYRLKLKALIKRGYAIHNGVCMKLIWCGVDSGCFGGGNSDDGFEQLILYVGDDSYNFSFVEA